MPAPTSSTPRVPALAASAAPLQMVKDVVELMKPRISAMSAIVAGGAMVLAPGHISVVDAAVVLLAIVMAVSGAGALNMVIERDVDGLMTRTQNRPLVQRRLDVSIAVVLGVALSVLSLPLLYVAGGALSMMLTAFSLLVYVLVYTPMKRKSPWALIVGAVPGAMPALMGSTAVSQTFDVAGLALFGVVFLWQIPHFLAISLYRQGEYDAAGHKIVPTLWGLEWAKALMVGTTAVLVTLGFCLWPLGLGSAVFAFIAAILGGWFLALTLKGYAEVVNTEAWARRVFFGSLVYQTVLFVALAADHIAVALFLS